MTWTNGDVSGSQTLTDSDHLYPAHINELRTAIDAVGTRFSHFNVKDYGATGDGATTDTTAIQAAIDAASVSGGIVFFPQGNYKTGALTVTSNFVYLVGVGHSSMLQYTGTSGDIISITGTLYCGIKDLSLHYTNTPGGGAAVHLDNASYTTLDGLVIGFYGPIWDGINLTNNVGGMQSVYIHDCKIYKMISSGIIVNTSYSAVNVINSVYMDHCISLWLANTEGETVPNTSKALNLYATSGALQGVNILNCEFGVAYYTFYSSGNPRFGYVANTYFDGVNLMDGLQMYTFTNCWFSGSATTNPQGNSLIITDCIGLSLSHSHIDPESAVNSSSAAVSVQGSSDHVQLHGNEIGGSAYYGITISGGDHVIVTNNYCGKSTAFGNTALMTHGVYIHSTFTGHAIVKNNDLDEATTAPYSTTSESLDLIVSDNFV